MTNLYDYDEPINAYAVDHVSFPAVPPWVDCDITPATVAAILEGGCDSGAYMPAVTSCDALATMAEYGDEVFYHLESWGELDSSPPLESWSQLACHFVSRAVETWAAEIEVELREALEEMEEESDD